MSEPGSTGYGREAGKIGNGDRRTLAEDEGFVDFPSVLYVGYEAENGVELAGCERIGGGKLRVKEAENLNEKSAR